MKHTKHHLTGPYSIGFTSHLLVQRSGLMQFRRLYRSHYRDDRHKTAAGLMEARREVRAEVAKWEAGVEADRAFLARISNNNVNNAK